VHNLMPLLIHPRNRRIRAILARRKHPRNDRALSTRYPSFFCIIRAIPSSFIYSDSSAAMAA